MAATSTISVGLARGLFYGGLLILVVTIGLSLYPAPSETPGLPRFPLVELSFPLIPLLWVLSIVLLVSGWVFHPRGSLVQIMIAAGGVFAAAVFLKVVSVLTAIPFAIDGTTVFVQPFGAQTTFLLTLGPLIALFGTIFWFAKRSEAQKFRGGGNS